MHISLLTKPPASFVPKIFPDMPLFDHFGVRCTTASSPSPLPDSCLIYSQTYPFLTTQHLPLLHMPAYALLYWVVASTSLRETLTLLHWTANLAVMPTASVQASWS